MREDCDDRAVRQASGPPLSELRSGGRAEGEDRFRVIFETAPVGIVLVNADHLYVDANPAICAMLGRSRDEFVGQRTDAFIPGEMKAEYERLVAETREAGHLHAEFPLVRNDGEWVHLEWRITRFDASGVQLCVASDITDRKRVEVERHAMEQTLQEREQQLRALVEASAQIVWTMDAGGAAVEDAPSWRAFTGQSYDEWKGWGWLDVLHPADRQRVDVLWRRAVAARTPFSTEYRIRHHSGAWRWMAVNAVPLIGPGEAVRGWVGMNADITDRKRTEKALQESERRYRTMFQLSAVGQAEVDPHTGRFVAVNKRLCEITGYDEKELLGKTFADITHPEDRETDRARFFQALAGTDGEYVGVKRYVRKDGAIRWVELRAELIRDEQGQPVRSVGIIVDVTERRQYEAALRQARDAAEAVSRLKSTLLANMSHEVRTPLTSLLLFADLLARRLTGRDRQTAMKVRRGAEQLAEILDAVLTLSRLEAGRVELTCVPIDVAEKVRDVAALLEPLARQKKLRMKVRGQAPCVALADHASMDSVLNNLIGNAIKFTQEGGVTVTVDEADDDRVGGPAVRIRVEDTGVGIASDFLPHVFDEFQQEATSVVRTRPGIGLGLAISKRLVDLMSGVIEVESVPGEGTTFTVVLPAAGVYEERGTAEETAGRPGDVRPDLLVMDDDELILELMQDLLSSRYSVRGASRTSEALELARAHAFDAVLLDIEMQERMSGIDVVQALRRTPAYRRVPIVAVTAYALPGDEVRLLEAGFDSYISKPFEVETLLGAIERVLRSTSR